jgi:hypothetical protein
MQQYIKFTCLICFLGMSTLVKGQTIYTCPDSITAFPATTPCTDPTSNTPTGYKVVFKRGTTGSVTYSPGDTDWGGGVPVELIIPQGVTISLGNNIDFTMSVASRLILQGTSATNSGKIIGNHSNSIFQFSTANGTNPATGYQWKGSSFTVDYTTTTPNNNIAGTLEGASFSSTGPLPVDMIDFSAERAGEFVNVKWSTASEQNSESFALLQSKDGINYTQIDMVKAAGFSHSIREYSSVVARPYVGTNHFKLVQTDIDGKFEEFYTNITYGDLKFSTSRPNPFLEDIQLNLVVSNDFSEVELMDIYGNIVYQNTFYTSENVTINTNDVVPGVYFLSIDGNVRRMVKN